MRAVRGLVLAGAVAVVGLDGCRSGADDDVDQAALPRATPAAAFDGGADAATGAQVAAYGGRLEFDTSVAAGDAQYMLRQGRSGIALGYHVTIAPEIGATRLSREELAAGRVIARLAFSRDGDSARALVFVYVDSTGTSWRHMLLTSDAGRVSEVHPMQFHRHPGGAAAPGRWMAPRARLIQAAGSAFGTPICIFCSEYFDWCGREPRLLSDPGLMAYLRNRLGDLPPVPGGPVPGMPM